MVIPIHAILRAATGVTIRSVTGSQRFLLCGHRVTKVFPNGHRQNSKIM